MALTTRLITQRTPLIAAVLVSALLGSVWAVVELAPNRTIPPLANIDRAEMSTTPIPKAPPSARAVLPTPDPTVCSRTADSIFDDFETLAGGEQVEARSASIALRTREYLDYGCPTAIHHGDWHTTAQILRVGLIHDVLRPQAEVYDDSLIWDVRAEKLVTIAGSTFAVRDPGAMCDEALRLDESDALSSLRPTCLGALIAQR